jgi:phenylacetate-CoA ligase
MANKKKSNKRNRAVMPGKPKTTPGAIPKVKIPAKKTVADSGMVWPGILPFPHAIPLALQFSFQVSEWWPSQRLLENQMRQVSALLHHAATSVPYYREKFRDHPLAALSYMTMDAFQALPLLRRADIQNAGKAMASTAIPNSHGKPFEIRSSGSTGRPIRVLGTGLTGIYVKALTMRGHLWHRRDLSAKNIDIRTARTSRAGIRKYRWSTVPDAGESIRLDINLPIGVLLEQLIQQDPVYMQTHPYTLKGLIECSVERGIRPKSLREVRTFGEALDQGIRDAARTDWGVEVIDNYSAMEIGTMAHQCPESENLHVQSESVLLEVLGDDDRPCSPGEVGRVVVTALHNFATPLIRYEIGDYAEVGEACACGRGLPVLKRIVGRQRNFLVLPTGEKLFPEARMILMDLAPEIRQFQLLQKTLENIEIKLAVTAPISNSRESKIAHDLNAKFGSRFDYQFIYVDDIPRSANGKFEEFKSEVL